MELNEFAIQLYHLVSDGSIKAYRKMFEEYTIDDRTIDYWKSALTFFKKLSDEDKDCFFSILRQVTIDTTAEILAVIDNSTYLKNKDDDLVLTFEKTPKINLSGELVDTFLGYDEEQDNKKEKRVSH